MSKAQSEKYIYFRWHGKVLYKYTVDKEHPLKPTRRKKATKKEIQEYGGKCYNDIKGANR